MNFETAKLHPTMALEVTGLDFSSRPTEFPASSLKALIDQHGVVVYRNRQPLSNEQHIAFSRLFGPIEIGPAFKISGDRVRIPEPAIVDVSNIDADNKIMAPDNRRRLFAKGNQLWHTDMSFMQNRATYSLLSACEIPPEGADTEFADMAAAYTALPEKLKNLIEDLTVEHSIWYSRKLAGFPEPTEEELNSQGPAYHKLVHVHEGSGRKILYIGAHASHIVGWPIELGRSFLNALMAFATQPEFIYRHKWKLGDVLMWDNLSTLHRATEFDDTRFRRDMRRTTCRERPADVAA